MDDSVTNFGATQYIRNITSNIALLVINILISLWYTPYLIRNLGSELFGFIPLADSVTYFFGIVTLSLNISTGRYFTIELEKGEITHANQIFNTALLGTFLLITVAAPIGIILVIFAPQIFNVPLNSEHEVQLLFSGVIIAFFATTLRINFSIATFAKNRFDLRNIVSLLSRLCQILIIVILFSNYPPNLLHVGIGALSSAVLAFAGDYYLWKHLLPMLSLSIQYFKRKSLRPLVGTSTWTLIYQIGALIFLNIDMLVANRTLELSLAGMFGALLVIPKNLRILANAVGGVWAPTILSKYSRSDFTGMDYIVKFSIKFVGLTMALPIGFLVGLATPFLVVWLGPDYEMLAWVLSVMIFHLSVNFLVTPFLNIQVTLNKVKIPALVTFTLGIAYYFLAVSFCRQFGPMGIVVAAAFTQTANNFIFMPIYAARIMNLAWWHYFTRLFPILLATLVVSIVSYTAGLIYPITSFFNLFLVGLLVSGTYLVIVYLVGLTKEDKLMVTSLLRKYKLRA